MDSRRFHRVTYAAPSILTHHDFIYQGRVANISLRGVLFSADECIMVTPGDICALTLHAGIPPLEFNVEVVHSFFSMVGVRFFWPDADTRLRLYQLLQTVTTQKERLKSEWDLLERNGSYDEIETVTAGMQLGR